ncbi:MAG: glycosyltransferase [Bacilli bacterium]
MENKKAPIILQINILCGAGSTGRIAENIGKLIEENGMKSYICYGFGKSDVPNSIKIGNQFSYYLHNVLSKLFCSQGLFSKFATFLFIQKLKKIEPDIIHLHNIHGNYLNYPLLFKYINKRNIPVVWTLHDTWVFTGKCVHFDFVKCDKWEKRCCHCPILSDYPKSYYFDRTTSNFDKKKRIFSSAKNITLVSPSNWLEKLVKRSFLKNKKIVVIPNGIDINIFRKTKEHTMDASNFIILGIANEWTQSKGLKDFVELSRRLDSCFKIVLIGVSKNQKNELKEERITFVNRSNNYDILVEWYNNADVLVNPTYEDNFPTVNLEAMACGTPVISYNTGGSPESINHETGIVVEKGNINELITVLEKMKNKELIFNGDSCIKNIKDNYISYNKFQEYINLYKKILSDDISDERINQS